MYLLDLSFVIFIFWNIFTFALMGLDKNRALKGKWRISENTLLIFAFCFGGIGIFTGMRIFGHKTRKKSFQVLTPIAIALNLMMMGYIGIDVMEKISAGQIN